MTATKEAPFNVVRMDITVCECDPRVIARLRSEDDYELVLAFDREWLAKASKQLESLYPPTGDRQHA